MTPEEIEKLWPESLIEDLAAIEHERWAGWERYRETAAHEYHHCGEPNSERWRRQRETPYWYLSEAEKQSDRNEAYKTLGALISHGVRNWLDRAEKAEAEVERLRRELGYPDDMVRALRGVVNRSKVGAAKVEKLRVQIEALQTEYRDTQDANMKYALQIERLKSQASRLATPQVQEATAAWNDNVKLVWQIARLRNALLVVEWGICDGCN